MVLSFIAYADIATCIGHQCRTADLRGTVIKLLDPLLCVQLHGVAIQHPLVRIESQIDQVGAWPPSICLCPPHLPRYLEAKRQLLFSLVLV